MKTEYFYYLRSDGEKFFVAEQEKKTWIYHPSRLFWWQHPDQKEITRVMTNLQILNAGTKKVKILPQELVLMGIPLL